MHQINKAVSGLLRREDSGIPECKEGEDKEASVRVDTHSPLFARIDLLPASLQVHVSGGVGGVKPEAASWLVSEIEVLKS